MEKASEGGQATESYTRSRLAHLERILQELSRHEERSTLQSVERTSMNTKQRLLNDQLLQTQEELAAAQASKAKLCEEIGALQQTKEDQAKQIAGYKMDLQTSRESQSMLAKKMEELETSARTMKQNYIKYASSLTV
ncbi:hypothetical protein PHYBOEH_007509 [Phytophthora boehmeriae]|uniref:Uncharacterized protein n=1 Tax=Phytophthora boehmeriae TaxID=109152 RepID=A0A8T1WB81_9STRA|nr:hypothetical protein PHYBOEH_007509 [Phytophthora boehmeriae]